jgi:hypothetical protein
MIAVQVSSQRKTLSLIVLPRYLDGQHGSTRMVAIVYFLAIQTDPTHVVLQLKCLAKGGTIGLKLFVLNLIQQIPQKIRRLRLILSHKVALQLLILRKIGSTRLIEAVECELGSVKGAIACIRPFVIGWNAPVIPCEEL